jgi:hypothetical protein
MLSQQADMNSGKADMNSCKAKRIWKTLFYSLLAIDLGLLGEIGWLNLAAPVAVHAQTSSQYPELDKNGKPLLPRPGPQVVYSPTDLAHNAVTLPASGATPNTNIVRVGVAKEVTYFVNCTQTVKVTINTYVADDQSSSAPNFTLYGTYDVVTGVAAGPQQVFIATELAPNVTSGTLATSVIRLPQLAVSFFETNAGATAGTCTARMMVGYN